MSLSQSQIDHLLRQESISDEWPWNTNDEAVIDKNIKDIVSEVRRKARVQDKTEFGHYGAGYASFVDCWLYRPTDEFRDQSEDCYRGLVVLFSRLSHYFVIGEGWKSCEDKSGGSYLPTFRFVDVIKQSAVKSIEQLVVPILTSRGLCRLHSDDLAEILPSTVRIPTVLEDRVYRHFDALFYWED